MTNDPHEILRVGREAGEEEIRQRYLELVRQFPPERDPQRFAEIRGAYDQLRDPVTHLDKRLFSLISPETLESLASGEQERAERRRIPTDVLLSLGDD